MPAQLILEFEGVTTKEYDAVNAVLGIDPATGSGEWPDGLQVHAAGLNEAGHLVVTRSGTPEHQARFMKGRLGAALAEGGIEGPPSCVTWIELVARHTPGAERRRPARRVRADVHPARPPEPAPEVSADRWCSSVTARPQASVPGRDGIILHGSI